MIARTFLRVLCGLVIAGTGGCVDTGERVDTACPDFAPFETHVAPLMERRCGSLDCHGAEGRPLLVYSREGRRRPGGPEDPDYVTGGLETTSFEREGTYQSVCGLQPEEMAAVTRGEKQPPDLTLVRKPRLEEEHEGGEVWATDSDPDRCLRSWLSGDVSLDACP